MNNRDDLLAFVTFVNSLGLLLPTTERVMAYTIAAAGLLLWLLALVTGHTMGGAIHLIFLAAIITMIARFILGGRRTR